MLVLTNEQKLKILDALLKNRETYGGNNKQFAIRWGINPQVYCTVSKNRNVDRKITDAKWAEIAWKLNVPLEERKWNTVRTRVFSHIEEDVLFCKAYGKSRMLVDECAIGKTYTAEYLARTLDNCFYVDCSQCTGKTDFIRMLATAIGAEASGRLSDIKSNIKYVLKAIAKPVVILDEAGDLEYNAFKLLKEFWNATRDCCGWYMMGADGLRTKINNGMNKTQMPGYRELFSRFSSKFDYVVPRDPRDRIEFYRSLVYSVISANEADEAIVKRVTNRCLNTDSETNETGLRRAEALLILELKQKYDQNGAESKTN